MEVEWPPHSRDWNDNNMAQAGPSSPPSTLSQRRKSSAAHARPALPPPNLPIPSIPDTTENGQGDYAQFQHSSMNSRGPRGPRSSSFARQAPSPSLTAVTSFSQSRMLASPPSQQQQFTQMAVYDDLSDPPPPSMLPASTSSAFPPPEPSPTRPTHLEPESTSSRPRQPSSRRALTRALELAREAVELDSTNDNPEAAVAAYGRSVALLSEVMERVRRGEDSTESSRRRSGRKRTAEAQEEEVARLQTIHDTYADRMNILSIIYSIPSAPYNTTSVYSESTDSNRTVSPARTATPLRDSSLGPQSIPHDTHAADTQDASDVLQEYMDQYGDFDRDQDQAGVEAIGAAMFMSDSDHISSSSAAHPYAAQTTYDVQQSRTSMQPLSRRGTRTSALLPPALPPPAVSPPPPPIGEHSDPHPQTPRQQLDPRQRGDSAAGHKRNGSGSRLAALQEELDQPTNKMMAASRRGESPPLPPLPSPGSQAEDSGTPRSTLSPTRAPPSPRSSNTNFFIPRPRGSSQASVRTDASNVINTTTTQGTIFQRRSGKSSAPPLSRAASPADSLISSGSPVIGAYVPKNGASSLPGQTSILSNVSNGGRSRSSSQPGRRPSVVAGQVTAAPPLPSGPNTGVPRKTSFPSSSLPKPPLLQVQTEFAPLGSSMGLSNAMPLTPMSPLPPLPPSDPTRKPYHLMSLLRTTMTSESGGYVTRRLHVPQEVWSQGGAKLNNLVEKIRIVGILSSALQDLQDVSSEYFGAGNVGTGMGLGIGSVTRKEGEAWIAKLDEFSTVCDGVVADFGKKLGVGEGFVAKKTTWGKLGRSFDKFTTGKNLDSPATYVQGLRRLFDFAQLLDEHQQAVTSQPLAPAYASFSPDIRVAVESRLKRLSEFFATVVLTFVVRDLSQLLDKYAKKCEKWLAE